jgi:UDP-N-acetylmuramoyl-tripeptide--D-alanyl-D-alanine ligase
MLELGQDGPALHFDVGKRVGAARPSGLITLGPLGNEILKGAQAAGVDESVCFHAGNHAEAVDFLRRVMPEGAWVLVKGSRGMTMERVVEAMVGEFD